MSDNIALAEPLPWRLALSIQEITDCFPVMKELRSHLELVDFIVGVASRNENRVRR
jgi:hypothetical protein